MGSPQTPYRIATNKVVLCAFPSNPRPLPLRLMGLPVNRTEAVDFKRRACCWRPGSKQEHGKFLSLVFSATWKAHYGEAHGSSARAHDRTVALPGNHMEFPGKPRTVSRSSCA